MGAQTPEQSGYSTDPEADSPETDGNSYDSPYGANGFPERDPPDILIEGITDNRKGGRTDRVCRIGTLDAAGVRIPDRTLTCAGYRYYFFLRSFSFRPDRESI